MDADTEYEIALAHIKARLDDYDRCKDGVTIRRRHIRTVIARATVTEAHNLVLKNRIARQAPRIAELIQRLESANAAVRRAKYDDSLEDRVEKLSAAIQGINRILCEWTRTGADTKEEAKAMAALCCVIRSANRLIKDVE